MRPGKDESHREPGGADLGALLREWPAPAPPAGIEDELRLTFRRRRGARGRRRLVWLSLAAALVLAAVLQRERMTPAVRPTPSPGSAPSASLPPRAPVNPVTEAVSEPRVAEAPPPPASVAPRAERSSTPVTAQVAPSITGPASEEAVVVEPGQAELLADLGRRLRGGISPGASGPIAAVRSLKAGEDGGVIQSMPQTDLPAYRARWETRADEWPRVERPAGGR